MFVLVQTPAGFDAGTHGARCSTDVTDYLLTTEKDIVEATFTVNGFSFAGRGQNAGLVFVRMKDYATAAARGPEGAGAGRPDCSGTSRATRTR